MNVLEIRNEILSGKSINDLKLRVVFYARVSTDYDTQSTSLENQVDFFTEYITNNKNWEYVGKYIDEGISGTSTIKRQNFLRMIKDSKKGIFDFIITKNVPRFARNTLDSISYTQELLKNNVGVLFLNDNINTLMPDSDLRLAIMSSIAQDEVRKLSENVKFGLKKSMERGKILGGNNLYGYNKINNKLIPINCEKQTITKMYQYFSTGKYNYKTLSKKLKDENILDRNNKEFNLSTIKRILTNPKYKGYYCGNKTKKIDYKLKKRLKIDKDKWIVYKDTKNIIPIVEEKLWNRVNNIIKKNKRNTFKIEKKLYTSKIICFEHKTYFTRNANDIWACKLYKKGKKYCRSVLLKEKDINIIIKKILKFDKNYIKKLYIKKINRNIGKYIDDIIDINKNFNSILDSLIENIIIKKINNNSKEFYIYIFTKYEEKLKIKYLL